MQVDINTIITVLTFLGGLIGVWTNLNTRLTKLESRLQFGDEKFDLIDRRFDVMMTHLLRIEDRLQQVADRGK
jgi:hypothetical protein